MRRILRRDGFGPDGQIQSVIARLDRAIHARKTLAVSVACMAREAGHDGVGKASAYRTACRIDT